MSKRTHASVTEEPCKCKYLENAARNASSPIKWDPLTGEYHIQQKNEKGGVSSWVIYHCPFCGGTAPPSLRGTLFETVSDAESARLFKLAEGVKTVEDAYAQLGKPDQQQEFGVGTSKGDPEKEPQEILRGTALIYTRLSETADLVISDYHKDRVGISLRSKGKQTGSSSQSLQ